jgi:ATP-binding cassette subfamily C protein CydC
MRALARAQGSSERLDSLLDQRPAVTDPPAPEPRVPSGRGGPVVELDAVTAAWTGGAPQLAPVDLRLEPGRHVAVVGPNGSGKSTLLAVLARALDPTSGRHTVDGTDVRRMSLADVRRDVAVVDDEPHVFATSLAENLRLARPGADDDALADALRAVGLGSWAATLADGLDTRLGTGGRGISGGERARLGVARAVLADRPVVLLDEPAAHLDHATASAVLDDVLDATRDRSVVMVSHRPEALNRFDAVLDLEPPSPTPPPQE